MKKLIHDYKEFTLSLGGARIVFFINSGLCLDRQPDNKSYMHSHYHSELFCVFEGEMELATEERTYKLTSGDSVLIPKNLMHRSSYSDDIFRISVAFSVSGGEKRPSAIVDRLRALTEGDSAVMIENSRISDATRRVAHYFYGKFDYKEELILGCLGELVALMCQDEHACGNSDVYTLDDSLNYRKYAVQSYFTLPTSDGSFSYDNLSLEELSRLLNLSPKQTQRTVKRVFGRTFREELVFLKMGRAGELLRTTSLAVNEIAATLGYSGTRSFFYAFKKEFGMTPCEYRKRAGEN